MCASRRCTHLCIYNVYVYTHTGFTHTHTNTGFPPPTGFTHVHTFPQWLSSKEFACSVGEVGLIPDREYPPEKDMVTYSSILAWKIPSTEEPGGLQSIGCKESNTTEQLGMHTHIYIHTYVYVCTRRIMC